MIPERFFKILKTSECQTHSYFPATEVFNEGWMLRLVLDAIQTLGISGHPFSFLENADWYSEARLESPFRPRFKADRFGEGPTNADGVIGHYKFDSKTKSRLCLQKAARQFVVIEAKMFSRLSSGIRNAPNYNQAARNIACMAQVLHKGGVAPDTFGSVGFFVVAPGLDRHGRPNAGMASYLEPDSICSAIHQRIAEYESAARSEAAELRQWESAYFLPLLNYLCRHECLRLVYWEDCIQAIYRRDPEAGREIDRFYQICRTA